MKLSSKARYGLKAMCCMADYYGKGVLSLPQMAQSIGVSEKYLEQLIAVLRKAGFVDANRGANAGYFLAKAHKDINVGEGWRALEDGLVIVDCISGECEGKCKCQTYNVWNKLYNAINECLNAMSLESLLNQ